MDQRNGGTRSTKACHASESKQLNPYTHLATSVMSQIPPIDLKSTMIKSMDHLMYQRILHMLFTEEAILTEKDAVRGRKSSGAIWRTGVTLDGGRGEGAGGEGEVFEHEEHGGACNRVDVDKLSCMIMAEL